MAYEELSFEVLEQPDIDKWNQLWLNDADLNSRIQSAGQKNYVVDGGFDSWEEGTSFTNPSTLSYTATMNQMLFSNTGTLPSNIIHSQQIENGESFYRINVDGAGSGFGTLDFYINTNHKIYQGVRSMCGDGKKVTVKFEARSDISNKKIGLDLIQNYGTGGSTSANEDISGTNWELTTDWVEYSYTFTTNTLSGKIFGTNNDDTLICRLWSMWGSDRVSFIGDTVAEDFGGAGNIDIRRLQVVKGTQTGDFIRDTPTELSDKIRPFFQKLSGPIYNLYGQGFALSATSARVDIHLDTKMITQPSVVVDNPTDMRLTDGTSNISVTNITSPADTTYGTSLIPLTITSAGLTSFRPYRLQNNNSTDPNIIIDARL